MKNKHVIAFKYAKALFLAAEEDGKLEEVGTDAAAILETLRETPELDDFLTNSAALEKETSKTLRLLFEPTTHDTMWRFLKLLIKNKRVALLKIILKRFEVFHEDAKNVVRARLEYAGTLSVESRQIIERSLSGSKGGEVIIEKVERPDLIGGIRLMVGGRLYDNSVRASLNRLRKALALVLLTVSLLSPNAFFPISVGAGYSAEAGRALKCATCGRKIRGQYLKLKGRHYCSKRCLSKSLPKCDECGRPSKYTSGKKHYCSNKCLEKSWPICASCHRHAQKGMRRSYKKVFLCERCAAKPKCFSCFMPADYGRLPDGRRICKKCNKTAVMDYDIVVKVAKSVRNAMREKLGLSTNHKIVYKMVGSDELSGKNEHGQSGTELGLYKFAQTIETFTLTKTDYLGRKTTTKEKRVKPATHTIYLLYGMPKNKLIEVVAHELGHDWMQEHLPKITNLTLKEGWAEYVASLVNSLCGRSKMNMRMKLNKDAVYGGGFRKIYKISRKNGLKSVVAYLEKRNKK